MESILFTEHHDLVTPDGMITSLKRTKESCSATVLISNISSHFKGFEVDLPLTFFNIKSTLAQVGVNGITKEIILDKKTRSAEVKIELIGIGKLGKTMLSYLTEGSYIGKLFTADDRRRVRNPTYLTRFFGRSDRHGRPLLSLGGMQGSSNLILDKIDNRAIAFLSLQQGILSYDEHLAGFLPTLAQSLKHPHIKPRSLLRLHQHFQPDHIRQVQKGELLLVRSLPLHIRTVFGKVVNELLPKGYQHTSACVLEPNTYESGDVYELYGSSPREINDIPLEFYTLEPFREHVFFSDRDQLQETLENPSALFRAFDSIKEAPSHLCSTFVVKKDQLINLTEKEWIVRDSRTSEFPGLNHPGRQALMVERYIQHQPSYPFLKAIEEERITSQGILLSRYFPSPLLKKLLLSDHVQDCLKGIYFQTPSLSSGDFFSHEDRSLLIDLTKFAIPVFWVDKTTGKILQYIAKPDKDAGMFVPLDDIDTFVNATAFGIYGSNLLQVHFEQELTALMEGVLELKKHSTHPLLNNEKPITLITGGGPGVMELGNRIAKSLNILSCANIADFRPKPKGFVNEQKQNPFIDAKMTYRIDKLIERQAEFNLDFPIFLMGGIGTDFEFALEELRRKVGSDNTTPVLLFGDPEYWKEKITSRFQCNRATGTIAGSEWTSNCFFCVTDATEGLKVYAQFIEGKLPIGIDGPIYDEGFIRPF